MGAAILFMSLQLRLAEPYSVVQQKLPTYTTWYGHCHLVSGGPGYVWLVEPYHVVPLKSSTALKHGIWVHAASFIYTIQSTICYVGCLSIANTLIYISLYLRNTAILENKKNSLYFLASVWEHLWPSHSRLVNCTKCEQIPCNKYVTNWSDWNVF